MAEVARQSNTVIQAVTRLFNAWDSADEHDKMKTLSVASGRGPKFKLEQVRDKLPEKVKEHNIKICKLF